MSDVTYEDFSRLVGAVEEVAKAIYNVEEEVQNSLCIDNDAIVGSINRGFAEIERTINRHLALIAVDIRRATEKSER